MENLTYAVLIILTIISIICVFVAPYIIFSQGDAYYGTSVLPFLTLFILVGSCYQNWGTKPKEDEQTPLLNGPPASEY